MGIEQISHYLANKLGDRLEKNEEEISVLKYGLFVIIHTGIVFLATIVMGTMINSLVEIILISFSSAILKRYSGGVHASSPFKCLLMGVSMSTILAMLCKIIVIKLDLDYILMILIIGITISYYVLYKRCPVGTSKNPLLKDSKRKLLRKKSFFVMNLYTISICSLFIMHIAFNNYFAITISISILFGTLVQIFALSKLGCSVITGKFQ